MARQLYPLGLELAVGLVQLCRARTRLLCRPLGVLEHEGVVYPEAGVFSRTVYRSLRPQWRQDLEIPIEWGSLLDNGMYRSHGVAAATSLKVELFDADVGLWGCATPS